MTSVRRLRRVTLATTFAYLVALCAIAFWPVRVDQGSGQLLHRVFSWLYRHDAPRWVDYQFLEFTANIVLFIPVGLFLVILAGARRWWLGPFTGLLASCVIETGQLLFLPARLATVNDVVANVSGAATGTLLAAAALAIAHSHERRSRVRARTERRLQVSPEA